MIKVDLTKIGHGIRYKPLLKKEQGKRSIVKKIILFPFLVLSIALLIMEIQKYVYDYFHPIPQFLSNIPDLIKSSPDWQKAENIKEQEAQDISGQNTKSGEPRVSETNQIVNQPQTEKAPASVEHQVVDKSEAPEKEQRKSVTSSNEMASAPSSERQAAALQEESKSIKDADQDWKKLSDTAMAELKGQPLYSIHLSSFKTEAEAQIDVQRWRKLGYTAFIQLTKVPAKGDWYRVYIGRFADLNMAKEFAIKMKERERISYAMPSKLKISEFQ